MRILFVIPSYKPASIYGGTTVAAAQLAESLVEIGHEVTVYTTTANGKEELNVIGNQSKIVDGVEVFYFKRITGDHTHISPALWHALYKNIKSYDVIHIHSWWSMLVIGAAFIAQLRGVKVVLSPHGMFSTYILKTNNSLLKKILHQTVGRHLLKRTYLHVSTQMELQECKSIIPDWQGHIIPNLVILSDRQYDKKINGVFTIGFLSRIDPKKGLDILIKALSNVSFPFELRVGGSGDAEYVEKLTLLAQKSGISDKIVWVGWKNGEEKFQFLADLDLFALTSHSENFAIVVIEALSVGTPVLLSDQVGLHSYVAENKYGWVCALQEDLVTQQLEKLVVEKEKIQSINKNAAAQIHQEYNNTHLAARYVEFYNGLKK